jgi:hypothetical protein
MPYSPDAIKAMLTGESIAVTGKVTIDNSFEIVAGVLKKYRGAETVVSIPLTVQIIDPFAFEGCKAMVSVEIPNSVEFIGSGAFRDCERLQEITIPASVREMGTSLKDAVDGFKKSAVGKVQEADSLFGVLLKLGTDATTRVKTTITGVFQGCSSLRSVTLSPLLSEIPAKTFMNCASLRAIELPRAVTSIGASAFSGCASLQAVELPAGVTAVESKAFYGCTSLQMVLFPAGLTRIGTGAFTNCPSLRTVALPPAVVSFAPVAFDEGVSVSVLRESAPNSPALPPGVDAPGSLSGGDVPNPQDVPYQCSVCGARLTLFQESCDNCKTKMVWK